jgi:gliding motility-associated-like protein
VLLAGYNITVFDRQGNVMFQGNTGWDGNVNGKPANQGVYLYTIDMQDADGTSFVLKLTVTLER